jgi:hypothetical protein
VLDTVVEQRAVGELGQRVVERLMCELLLELHALRDVEHHPSIEERVSFVVAHDHRLVAHPHDVSVFSEQPVLGVSRVGSALEVLVFFP